MSKATMLGSLFDLLCACGLLWAISSTDWVVKTRDTEEQIERRFRRRLVGAQFSLN